ncbi:polysaccharide biosynthesis/export family protein [Adhaeribacter aquaticus]|uniref:polysaccharide biosynthesis/export family protein n=1 Tax=Adhaeribacter aquaticus TaxID=299567 RepID=UPI0003FFDFAD|nr:polysaccharide biosynthesis/export family protein [Adhaeribacter aquaticus]
MKLNYFLLVAIIFNFSCTPRNLAYFSDLKQNTAYEEAILNDIDPKIQTYDLLSITVTSLNPEANALFNTGVAAQAKTITDFSLSRSNNSELAREGYLVDKTGSIDFPVLGKIKLVGLTKTQATEMLKNQLKLHLKDPIINVRFLNFKITVVGEVNRPATFSIPSERINILEALGMAGDMTAFGKRENVLIIREENGIRKMTRLNLNNKEILNSPYFYLQQNDVIYIEPDKMKQVQASTNTRTISIIASLTTLLIVVASRLL